MYVSELTPGMLLELEPGFRYYMQESSNSKLPRLRIAPDVIAVMVADQNLEEDQNPIMYLGETKNQFKKKKKNYNRSLLRTVMVDGQVAYVVGREFRKLFPIFSGSFEGDKLL